MLYSSLIKFIPFLLFKLFNDHLFLIYVRSNTSSSLIKSFIRIKPGISTDYFAFGILVVIC